MYSLTIHVWSQMDLIVHLQMEILLKMTFIDLNEENSIWPTQRLQNYYNLIKAHLNQTLEYLEFKIYNIYGLNKIIYYKCNWLSFN